MGLNPYKRLTAKSFRALRKKLGLSGEQMAKLCGASSGRVVRKWEAGDNEVPHGTSRFLWLFDNMSPGSALRAQILDSLLDG